MKNLTILFLILLVAFFSNAQTNPPSIEWQKCLGGSSSDHGQSIQLTKEGGFIVSGYSDSNDGDVSGHHGSGSFYGDYWLVKLDSSGNIQWQKSLGGTGHEYCFSIIQTNDTGYIVTGGSDSNDGDVTGNHGGVDIWVVKLDTAGNIQWQRSLGGTNADFANSVQQTNDKGFIVAGRSASNDGDVSGNHGTHDYWIVKLDSSGNLQWQKSLGGTNIDFANSIQQTNDKGFIVAGWSASNDGNVTGHHGNPGDYDYWVVKLDSSGNLQWQKSIGGTDDDVANSIQQTNDRGFIVAGWSSSNDGDVSGHHGSVGIADYWIVKLDSIGNLQWQKSFGGSNDDEITSIQQTNDRGYIVAGWSSSNDGDVTGHHGGVGIDDYWIVKLDSLGNLQWEKCMGSSYGDRATSIQQINYGKYIIAGYTGFNDGDVSGNHGNEDYWIVKLGSTPLDINQEKISSKISIYPNPTLGKFTIQTLQKTSSIEILNIIGQVVEKRDVKGQKAINIEIKEEGIYIIRVVSEKELFTKKIIVEK